MSTKKSTRSTATKDNDNLNGTSKEVKAAKVPALRKIFFFAESLLENAENEFKLERFYHPGKGHTTLFLTCADKYIMEVLEFAEPYRSWLIDSSVCSNGRIYITTPIDVTFLALHHIRKHCAQKALELNSILSDDPSTMRLLSTFLNEASLNCIADVKTIPDSDMVFYKYNAEKTLAWLVLKARNIADTLKKNRIYCGLSAVSQNYTPSDKADEENTVNDVDYMRMACDIVGDYVDLDLHEALTQYLDIPSEIKALVEEKTQTNKRKSLQTLNAIDSKKIKLETEDANTKLKNSSLLDESLGDDDEADIKNDNIKIIPKSVQTKERVLTTKEKALAKSAKGTRSIASFFKK